MSAIRTRFAALLLVAIVGLAGCVGPATTNAAYEGKARRTAQDSLSALNLALLAVRTSLDGKMLHNYVEVLLSTAEDDFSSIQATFDSIQPPDSTFSDELRDTLDGLLSDGSDGIAQLRIAARRRDSAKLAAQAQDLAPTSQGLAAFVEAHGG